MADFYEIDFLEVHTQKSGDAISLRYEINGKTWIHVVDGGYESTGPDLTTHIRQYYGNPSYIDAVVVTHPDQDHACGLQTVLEEFDVVQLWMLRPWMYASEIISQFARYSSAESLAKKLRETYPYIATLEDIAIEKGIPIYEPFQGTHIGAFTVLAPSRQRYLQLIVQSEKTPQPAAGAADAIAAGVGILSEFLKKAANLVRAAWGEEVFSTEETSVENEMSVIQYAPLCGQKIVLTGDAGRGALTEAANYAPFAGLALPGVNRFQVPHHGGRRNVSTEILDHWLGQRLPTKPSSGSGWFTAIINAAREDDDHPRNAVVRAMIHRGANVLSTDDGRAGKWIYSNAPARTGWTTATPVDYPDDQEE